MPEESGVSGGSRMTGGKNILVVDDEQMIREALTSYLEKQGCHVFQAETGREALQVFQRESISFVILDLMLPDFSGEEVCIRIRKESRVPVIMLTAKTMETDMLNGLDIGADDYITKPFSMKVLIKKIAAVFRRCENRMENGLISYKSVTIDTDGHKVFVNGGLIEVTQKEFELLEELLRNQGRVLTRPQLLDKLWGYDFYGDERIVDSHIKNLRKKLGVNYIDTIRGVGYRIDKEN